MAKPLKNTRKWLQKHEVFFTTFCAFILSVMGIIVSIRYLNISELQSKMEYHDKIPEFNIQREYLINSRTEKYDEVILEVYKKSGKTKNITIDIIVFCNIETTDDKNNTNIKSFNLYHYYDTYFKTGNSEGKIQTAYAYENNKRYIEFENEIYNKLKAQYLFVDIKLITVVKVSYLNFLNEEMIEYYKVDGLKEEWVTNKGEDFFIEHNNNFSSRSEEHTSELQSR